MGKFDEAIADFTVAIGVDPKDATLYYYRAAAYDENNQHDQAIADYDAAIRMTPKYANAYYGRGMARAARGDQGRAIADFTLAIRLRPKFVQAYFNRGLAHYFKGDLDETIADCTQVIHLDPGLAIAITCGARCTRRRATRPGQRPTWPRPRSWGTRRSRSGSCPSGSRGERSRRGHRQIG